MKKIKAVCIAVLTLCASTVVFSQNSETSVQYVMSIPTAKLSNYISNASFGGVAIDYRKRFTPRISAGFDIGFNLFSKKENYATYTDGTSSISGTQYRYSQSYPIHVTGAYYFNADRPISFFAGFGIGTVYTNRNTDFGLYEISNEAWQFSLKPEAGFVTRFNADMGLKTVLKYHSNFKSSDLDGQSYISLGVGVVFLN